ncbi:MAG: hypothetical protein VB111_05210 [Clostridiaceae bacterium]|nr:hypothetical protein [Clostridiaceae bacterium]
MTSQTSGTSSATSETTTTSPTDYNAVFAEYGIEPADELIPWACYFVDNFPVGECDVRFVNLADGDNPEMLVTHFQYDENGLLIVDLYLCVMDSRGVIAATWSYRLEDNSRAQYCAAYLIDFDGDPALLMYYRLTLKGTTTERYDIYRFDEDGNRIMVSAEESSFPDSQVSDTALFKENYAPRLKNAIVVINFPSPWHDAVYYDESLPVHAFAKQNTPINQLRREEDNFIAITSYAIDEKTSAVSIKGYTLRYAGGKDTFGRFVYDATAIIEFTCPGDTGITYKTETGEQASVPLLSFLQNNLSAFGTVIYDGAQPVYRFRTLHGEIVSITEP